MHTLAPSLKEQEANISGTYKTSLMPQRGRRGRTREGPGATWYISEQKYTGTESERFLRVRGSGAWKSLLHQNSAWSNQTGLKPELWPCVNDGGMLQVDRYR